MEMVMCRVPLGAVALARATLNMVLCSRDTSVASGLAAGLSERMNLIVGFIPTPVTIVCHTLADSVGTIIAETTLAVICRMTTRVIATGPPK